MAERQHEGEEVRQAVGAAFDGLDRVVLAVSGGVDSMVLLRLLDTLAKSNHSKIVVAHFNPRLRARSSAADERLVRRTARRMGWPAIVERGNTTLSRA